jgi:ATP-dependent exoDNAse (exonuclease V) alpha subunit
MADIEIKIRFLSAGPRRDDWFAGDAIVIDGGSSGLRKNQQIGIAGEGEMVRDGEYRLSGHVSEYRHRKQFKFRHYVESEPLEESAIVKYLAEVGKGCGIGPSIAQRICDELGGDCLQTIRDKPLILCDLFRTISDENAEEIASRLRRNFAAEQTYIELQSLFDKRSFPKSIIKKVIAEYGAESLKIVRRNPFALLKFDGVGFKLCDRLFCDLNQGRRPERRLRRIAHLICHVMQQDRSGSTWHDAKQVLSQAIAGSACDLERVKRAVRFGIRAGILETLRTDGENLNQEGAQLFLAIAQHAHDERTVADRYCSLLEDSVEVVGDYERVTTLVEDGDANTQCARCGRLLGAAEIHVLDGQPYGPTCINFMEGGAGAEIVDRDTWLANHKSYRRVIRSIRVGSREIRPPNLWPEHIPGLSDHQATTWLKATEERIGALLGCGGTGKTFTVAQALAAISQTVPLSSIAMAAPTGKAAVRLTELLNAYGVGKRAHTLHKLLGYDGDGFAFHRRNQWHYRVLIIDEFSMVPISLLRAVLDATAPNTHVLFVGDIQQLAPVGHGAPLRDLIAAGISQGELFEIQRNAGGIVRCCHAIRHGSEWEPHDNLTIGSSGAEGMLRTLVELGKDCDPIWDVQAIVGSNDKGELSREVLNKAIQAELNANGESHADWPFKVGDKIVNRKNGWLKAIECDPEERNERGECYTANGELARVLELADKFFTCELYAPSRIVKVFKGGNSFELGYALTAHSCQGAEWPKVVVGLDPKLSSSPIYDRSWLYTALSRAKQHCHIVGEKHQADAMCRIQRTQDRRTFLRQRILLQQANSILMEV